MTGRSNIPGRYVWDSSLNILDHVIHLIQIFRNGVRRKVGWGWSVLDYPWTFYFSILELYSPGCPCVAHGHLRVYIGIWLIWRGRWLKVSGRELTCWILYYSIACLTWTTKIGDTYIVWTTFLEAKRFNWSFRICFWCLIYLIRQPSNIFYWRRFVLQRIQRLHFIEVNCRFFFGSSHTYFVFAWKIQISCSFCLSFESLFLFKERSFVDGDGISQIRESFLQGIGNLSLSWWKFPNSTEIFVLHLFELDFKVHNHLIFFLKFSMQLAVLNSIGLKKFFHLKSDIFRYLWSDC